MTLNQNQKIILVFQSFSSGLPLALVTSVLQSWYSLSGASLYFIGFLGLVAQPYTYKFLWAPLIENYYLSQYGKFKTWLCITQILLIISVFSMGLLSPLSHPMLLAMLALFTALFSATQDIVVDGYRVSILTLENNTQGMTLYLLSFRTAYVISNSFTLFIAEKYGWHIAYLTISLFFIPSFLSTLNNELLINNKQHQILTLKKAYVKPIKALVNIKNFKFIFFFVIVYGLGDIFVSNLTNVYLLKSLKLSLSSLSLTNNLMNVLGLFTSTLAARYFLKQYSIYYCLLGFGYLQFLMIILFCLSVKFNACATTQILLLTGENFAGGMCAFATYVFLNNLCEKKFSMVHYTLLNAAIDGLRLLLLPITGLIGENYGWLHLFNLGILFTLPGLLSLPFLPQMLDWITKRPNQYTEKSSDKKILDISTD